MANGTWCWTYLKLQRILEIVVATKKVNEVLNESPDGKPSLVIQTRMSAINLKSKT